MANLERDDFGDELIFDDSEVQEIANQISSQKLERAKSTKPKSEKRQRQIVVSVRLTPEEYEKICLLAEEAQVKIGTYLRDSALHTSSINSIEISSERISRYFSTIFAQKWISNTPPTKENEESKDLGSSDYKPLFNLPRIFEKSA